MLGVRVLPGEPTASLYFPLSPRADVWWSTVEEAPMGRLISFVLGGAAVALYAPQFFLPAETLAEYTKWWQDTLGADWYQKIFQNGPGVSGVATSLRPSSTAEHAGQGGRRVRESTVDRRR
jgi:hypothetical protein